MRAIEGMRPRRFRLTFAWGPGDASVPLGLKTTRTHRLMWPFRSS